jgi:CMP-N-acetylneuraminic acid synthetase
VVKKNLQLINGLSLIEIGLLKGVKADVDKVVFSSDSEPMLDFAGNFSVIVHKRSEKNSSDSATTESVILEVIETLNLSGQDDHSVGFLQVTAPFVQVSEINSCFHFADQGFSTFTAKEFHGFEWRLDDSKWKAVNHQPTKRFRRQDLDPSVIENGGVYAFPLKEFMIEKYRFCSEVKPIMAEIQNSIEIDSYGDLEIARILASKFPVI